MKKHWFYTGAAMVVAAILALPSASEAQKGKGGGKGSGKGGGQPSGSGKSDQTRPGDQPNSGKSSNDDKAGGDSSNPDTQDKNAKRPLEHPKSGNSLPQEVRDKLPPGLRDKPDNHPGLANHLRKMGVLKDHPAIDPVPPDVRSKLPPGLRDQPYDHPGVANHLGKMGWTIGPDGALVPPATLSPSTLNSTPSQSFQPLGGIFRRR